MDVINFILGIVIGLEICGLFYLFTLNRRLNHEIHSNTIEPVLS